MKIFISWSGELSRELGNAIRSWIPTVLQSIKPYYTPKDIEKGARWNTEIAKALEESKIGIFCITSTNHQNPWILFEAGAISRIVNEGLVCTILFDLKQTELTGPLSQFQATYFNKDDFFDLLSKINNELDVGQLDSETLKRVFDKWWPDLERDIQNILANHSKNKKIIQRKDRDILEEILGLVRLMAKKDISMLQNLNQLNEVIESARSGEANYKSTNPPIIHSLRSYKRNFGLLDDPEPHIPPEK